MRNAQISVEMMIILSALMIIFMTIISTFGADTSQAVFNRRTMDAKDYSENLASAIDNAYLGGDGSSVNVFIPTTLYDNTQFGMNIYPAQHTIDISWQATSSMDHSSVQILTSSITGRTTNLSGQLNIHNQGGILTIS